MDSENIMKLKQDIIEVLEDSNEPLSYRQIAKELDVENSKVQELLIDLVELEEVKRRSDWLFESL